MSEKIKVSLPGNVHKEVDKGTTTLEILGSGKGVGEPIAAIINGEIRELFRPLNRDSEVIPIDRIHRIGYSIYARSISYLFVLATRETFPGSSVLIDHSINDEIYGEIRYKRPITEADIKKIKQRMIEIVEEDSIIEKVKVKKEKAIELFKSYGATDKLSLMKNATDYDEVYLYKCRGYFDYFYGPMVPSMGYLSNFDLLFFEPGFLLMLPDK